MEYKYNTTLIIGNGFDLNIGMDTKYDSFFVYLENSKFFDQNNNNPLIRFIYDKGKRELWYDFEAIIKEYATKSENALLLRRTHKFQTLLEQYEICEECLPDQLLKFADIRDISEYLDRFFHSLKTVKEIDSKFVLAQRETTEKVKKDIKVFQGKCRDEAKTGIALLSQQLSLFIKRAHYNFDYSASLFLMAAVLGVYNHEKRGYVRIADQIIERYADPIDDLLIPTTKIISFNYTNALESISSIIEARSNKAIDLQDTELQKLLWNIHGTLNTDVVFGIDDAENVPHEFWELKKKNKTPTAKQTFQEILRTSKRIVIFGHSVHGVDLEYYRSFFLEDNFGKEIYIVGHCQEALDAIKIGLEENDLSPNIKYIIDKTEDFYNLCKDVSDDENSQIVEYYSALHAT